MTSAKIKGVIPAVRFIMCVAIHVHSAGLTDKPLRCPIKCFVLFILVIELEKVEGIS